MTKFDQNLIMVAGDQKNIAVAVTDSTGGAVDLTGHVVKWALAREPKNIAIVSKSSTVGTTVIEITNSTAGLLTVKLVAADTDALKGVYYHEIQSADTAGNLSTVLSGHITILRDLN